MLALGRPEINSFFCKGGQHHYSSTDACSREQLPAGKILSVYMNSLEKTDHVLDLSEKKESCVEKCCFYPQVFLYFVLVSYHPLRLFMAELLHTYFL